VTEPSYLGRYRSGQDKWEDLAKDPNDYKEVRSRLDELQSGKCAYCESDFETLSKDPHVDHFRKRNQSPELTFQWGNLFCSCTTETHCARYKDKLKGLDSSLLLKPDEDNARGFLHFSTDGSVSPKLKLDDTSRRRAEETIRGFNLDSPKLRGARRSYLRSIEGELRSVEEMGLSDSELHRYVEDLRQTYADGPFSTAILSLF